jgi:hypothetical protein
MNPDNLALTPPFYSYESTSIGVSGTRKNPPPKKPSTGIIIQMPSRKASKKYPPVKTSTFSEQFIKDYHRLKHTLRTVITQAIPMGVVSKVVIEGFPPVEMGVWRHERLRWMKEIFLRLLTDRRISPMVNHPEILPCAGWKSTPPAPVRMTITPLPVILIGCELIDFRRCPPP